MPKLTPQMFAFLQAPQAESVLLRLYTQALKQNRQMFFHFLPKIFKLLGKGLDWTGENESFYEDKYIPMHRNKASFCICRLWHRVQKTIVEIRDFLRHFDAVSCHSRQSQRRARHHLRISAAQSRSGEKTFPRSLFGRLYRASRSDALEP